VKWCGEGTVSKLSRFIGSAYIPHLARSDYRAANTLGQSPGLPRRVYTTGLSRHQGLYLSGQR